MRVYIDNVRRTTTESQLQKLFEDFGTLASVMIVRERPCGPSCGFGFVEMPARSEARRTVTALDGSRLASLVLTVEAA